MSYVISSIASQQATISANNAQASAMSASQGMQNLARGGGDIKAIQAKEQALVQQKQRAELEAKVAAEKKKALKEKEAKEKAKKANKLNYLA